MQVSRVQQLAVITRAITSPITRTGDTTTQTQPVMGRQGLQISSPLLHAVSQIGPEASLIPENCFSFLSVARERIVLCTHTRPAQLQPSSDCEIFHLTFQLIVLGWAGLGWAGQGWAGRC